MVGAVTIDLYQLERKPGIIKPESVINWHRKREQILLELEERTSRRKTENPKEKIDLIKQLAEENLMRGTPCIHGEILKLGYDVSESSGQLLYNQIEILLSTLLHLNCAQNFYSHFIIYILIS